MTVPPASNDRFYTDLPVFDEFDRVTDLTLFRPAPDDWHVVIADIRGSTQAVSEGRYKEVNMVGAACIMAATNAVTKATDGTLDIPFVFGGDGATLLIPDSLIAGVRAALLGAAALARREFDFELRIGSVPVTVLRAAGVDMTVAKFRLSPGNDLAQLGGGGIRVADDLIRADEDATKGYRVLPGGDIAEPDMTGLRCRWEPLMAQGGVMALALAEDAAVRRNTYDEVIGRIETILGGDLRIASPVTEETMRFKWIPKGLRMEAKITAAGRSTWRRYVYLLYESLIQYFLEKFDKKAGNYNAPVYREKLRANSDFRRFNDVLCLVQDCTREQADAIADLLAELRGQGRVAYGLQLSDHALMTCLIFDLKQSEHVHFVDGGLGGFTEAARGFKVQLKKGGV